MSDSSIQDILPSVVRKRLHDETKKLDKYVKVRSLVYSAIRMLKDLSNAVVAVERGEWEAIGCSWQWFELILRELIRELNAADTTGNARYGWRRNRGHDLCTITQYTIHLYSTAKSDDLNSRD